MTKQDQDKAQLAPDDREQGPDPHQARLQDRFPHLVPLSRCVLLGAMLCGAGGAWAAVEALNDTGIVRCATTASTNAGCPAAGFPLQDAQVGRDVNVPDPTDGLAGFSFTKLDAAGNVLDASAPSWSCVLDNVTKLIWEIKTFDGGQLDAGNRFSWYSTSVSNNGGVPGLEDPGAFCAGYVPGTPGTYCNTQAYVNRVNNLTSGNPATIVGLCGATDWRLPSLEELRSLAHYGFTNPAIDTGYFGDMALGPQFFDFWSGTPYAKDSDQAWLFQFETSEDAQLPKASQLAVRLVRAGRVLEDEDVDGDGDVDFRDVQAVINTFLGRENEPRADVNKDGKVDIIDVMLVIKRILSI